MYNCFMSNELEWPTEQADYSENPRKQESIEGQNAAIRFFDPEDKKDMGRLHEIISDEEVQRWMDDVSDFDKEGLLEWAQEIQAYKDKPKLFVVSGRSGGVGKRDIGETQGFVYTYPDADIVKLRSMFEDRILLERQLENPIFELSYAKFPDAEDCQIASAVRQVCIKLGNIMDIDIDPRTGEPKLTVTAYVDPVNKKSVKVLEAAGFVKRGKVLYSSEATKKDDVYVLDWNLLSSKLQNSRSTF